MSGEGTRAGTSSRDSTLVIHEALRKSILWGELAPGEWVSQVRLAKQFGVSRGPVREALRLLEREGLIEASVNQRVRVTSFSIDDLEQLYATRIAHDSLALAISAPRHSDEDFTELERLLDRLDELAGTDLDGWEEEHRRFHMLLLKNAGARLTRTSDQLYDHSERYRRAYNTTGSPRVWSLGASEHRQIVVACRLGDGAIAAALLARHLSRTALSLLAVLAPEHEPAAVRTAVRQVTEGIELEEFEGGEPEVNPVLL